jgi:tetratricopeptide (TPR) repeat protein
MRSRLAVRHGAGAAALASAIAGFAPAEAAAVPFDRCADLLSADGSSRAAASCFYDTAASTGRWVEAEQRLRAAASAHPEAGWLLYYLAQFTTRVDPGAAVAQYRGALDRFLRRGDPDGEVHARVALSVALFQTGDAVGSGSEAGQALEVAEATRDPHLRAQALVQTAWLAVQRNEQLAAASRALHDAHALAVPDGPYALQIRVLSGLGNVAFLLGRYDHALARFSEAADLARRNHDADLEAVARFNVVTTQRRQMEWLPDRARLAEMIDAARTAGGRGRFGQTRAPGERAPHARRPAGQRSVHPSERGIALRCRPPVRACRA